MQELKLEKGEELDEIREWSSTIEGKLVDFEGAISELKRLEKEIKSDELKGQEELAAETKRKQFEEELKFEQEKFERRLQHEKALAENKKSHLSDFGATKSITKLPKLVITKFNGQHTDWLRFWGQFKAEIEESEVSQVTKFSYLKELVEPKVRSCIDGLPFNSEGYERAKNILETKYGKNSEVINAHVQNIINLPTIQGTKPAKIHAFYETLLTSVQSLETLGKLKEVSGYVRMTIDKLEGIRNDLVRTDDDWQGWKYPELIEALRKWTVRNPVKSEDNHPDKHNKSKNFQTRQESKPRVCVYCDDANHRSAECKKVVTVADRRKILGDKQLCFNCTGQRHKAADCRSQQVCQHCKRRHHPSICNKKMDDQGKGAQEPEQMLVAKGENKVIYPVVMVKADGITCRALAGHEFTELLRKYSFWKTMRITTWVFRFLHNPKSNQRRREGPLTTEEIQQQIDWWLKREQSRYEDSDQTRKDEQHLNLKKNERGLLECQGRIQGEYPIYIPPESILAEKLVMHEHQSTLHGGVSMTMSAVREKYWIPRLRRLTKKVRNNCNGCKRFQTTAFAKPPTGNLPRDRTDGTRPFQVVGVDYAGPFIYKRRADKEGKAYLLLIGCSLTRAIHLEVVPDLSTEEFMHSFKRFIARRGKPDKVYSDNAKTFLAAAKRVRKISKDDQVNDYLARNNIKWQFNLSKAPWWGGQYERLIGLVKQSFYKVVGRSVSRGRSCKK